LAKGVNTTSFPLIPILKITFKGQPISIDFDHGPPRRASAPASSLLSRIQKPPLLDRLGQAQTKAKASMM
jgi:hypothetical protein